MRLGQSTNSSPCEYEMQEKFCEWLDSRGLRYIDELRVKEVKRIADFIVLKSGNGLINIEAKCDDFACMIKQLDDHSKYCNYSFAFIQSRSITPKLFKRKLSDKGYGLIIFNWETREITEVLEAHRNKVELKNLNTKVTRQIVEKYEQQELKL